METKSLVKNYFNQPQNKIRKIRYSWAEKFCNDHVCLDLVCGDGFGTKILSVNARSVDGFDEHEENILFAYRNFYVDNTTRYIISTITEFILKNKNKYDTTILFDIQNFHNNLDEFMLLINSLQSTNAIIGYAGNNLNSIINQYILIFKHNMWNYELFYEHEKCIDKFSDNAIGVIFLLKNIRKNLEKQTENPLVSVVIPTYNSDTTLEETIQSALNQSYPNLEVLVIDDGSNDNTSIICKKFQSKIRYYYKKNGGISTAVNFGIKEMKGEWFKWLSADDVLTKDAITKLMHINQKTGGLIIYSDYDLIDEQSNYTKTFSEPIYHNYYEFASKIWIRYIGNASSILIHKSCFKKIGLFDENLKFGEDYEWWQRACLVYGYRFFHLRESIVKYRIHPKQTTSKVSSKTFENDQKIRQKIKDEVIRTDPEWWYTLERYRKVHNKINIKIKFKRLLKKMLRFLNPSIEKKVVNWRIKSLKKKTI